MMLTILMAVILVVAFALMFGLVNFSENVIATPASEGSAARASDAESAL